jgi:predicted NAD-dependent protein-ADP-ribosyltransferase YbiA (DUF1768 family)
MAIWFYSKSAEYGWLLNFSGHGFVLDGVHWPSVDHYYQAQKYPHSDAAERIRRAPLKARKAGQDRSLLPRGNWEAAKEEVMSSPTTTR